MGGKNFNVNKCKILKAKVLELSTSVLARKKPMLHG